MQLDRLLLTSFQNALRRARLSMRIAALNIVQCVAVVGLGAVLLVSSGAAAIASEGGQEESRASVEVTLVGQHRALPRHQGDRPADNSPAGFNVAVCRQRAQVLAADVQDAPHLIGSGIALRL